MKQWPVVDVSLTFRLVACCTVGVEVWSWTIVLHSYCQFVSDWTSHSFVTEARANLQIVLGGCQNSWTRSSWIKCHWGTKSIRGINLFLLLVVIQLVYFQNQHQFVARATPTRSVLHAIFMSTDLIAISSLVMVALSQGIWYWNECRYLLISKAQVQSKFSVCEIYGGQSVARLGFSSSIAVFDCLCHSTSAQHSLCVLLILHSLGKWQVSLDDTQKQQVH